MKQKVFFIAGVFLFVGLAVLVIRLVSGLQPKQGELRIESQPEVAAYLDNKSIGKTPIKKPLLKVDGGEHTLKLASDLSPALASWESKIRIVPNTVTAVTVVLSESELTNQSDVLWMEYIGGKKAEVIFQSDPDGAIVMVDQDMKGVTPLTLSDLSEGKHEVFVSARGYLPRTVTVKVTPGYRINAQFQLALSPGTDWAATPTPTPSATESAQISLSPTPPGGTKKPSITPTGTVESEKPEPKKPYAIVKDTPTGFLRLRMEPSTTATEVAKLNPGEKFTILSEESGWYELLYSPTQNGWASGQYLTKVE